VKGKKHLAGRESKRKKRPEVKRPRQPRFAGMEDAKIEALENAALDYAHVRDQRQQLTAQEVPLKQELIALMKKEGRETYRHENVEIKMIHEKESVKVRIRKPKKGDEGE
jgi:hypothetical protein